MQEAFQEIDPESHDAADPRRSDAQFRRLIEKLPTAAYICDADGRITYFNPHAERLWGRAPLLNDPVERFCGSFKLISSEGLAIPHDRCWMALALQEGREYSGHEIVIEKPNGERVAVLVHISPIYSSRGELLGAVNVIVDITNRKRIEETRGQLAAIVESSDDAIIGKTLDGTIVSWNRGAEEIYGYSPGEAVGQPISILLPPERADELPSIMERLRRGERIDHYETKRQRKDGTVIDVSVTISPIRTDTGELIGASAVARNITDRKRIEEERARLLARERAALAEAERAHRVKDQFLAMVSHDLRTPIQAILGWAHLLRTGRIAPQGQADALQIIERNAKAQAKLIGDLLDMSRMVAGKVRLDRHPVDVTSVIAAAIDTVRPSADAKGVQIQTQLDPEAGPLYGDADRLQQVVLNLLSNAVKFTPQGGRVQVRVVRVNSHVEIAVSDTGEGIEANFLPHVFELFRQAESDDVKPRGGLGLGLAIVRHLVELHGGQVRVESPGRGQGTTFTVRLPV